MTFALLLHTPYGWTDLIGDERPQFDTEADARDASIKLDDAWGTASEWKIIPANELSNYDLVA